jgi:hypothetical protein
MAIALRYCGFGAPNISRAVAAIDLLVAVCTFGASCVRFEVMIVLLLSLVAVALMIWVGSKVLLA